MNYNLEIQKIRLKLKSAATIEDSIILAKQAIQLADRNNDIETGFEFRLRLINEEVNTSKCIDSFSAFSWILETRDHNPELFDESEFLWEYKWMANASYRNASISKLQIENILKDLKTRMKRNGYSLRGYYSILIAWKQFLGEKEEVDHLLELRDLEQRDDMSHCPACELDTKVEIELEKGNFDQAILMAHDLITKKLTCAHMPFATFSEFAYHLNKAGNNKTSEFFDKALKELDTMADDDSSILATISLLINYLIDNNKEKAFAFFEKYSVWELEAEDSLKFTFAKNIFNLFKGEGFINLTLDNKHPLFNISKEYDLKKLYNFYYTQAYDLAVKFDHRNETSSFMENLTLEKNR